VNSVPKDTAGHFPLHAKLKHDHGRIFRNVLQASVLKIAKKTNIRPTFPLLLNPSKPYVAALPFPPISNTLPATQN